MVEAARAKYGNMDQNAFRQSKLAGLVCKPFVLSPMVFAIIFAVPYIYKDAVYPPIGPRIFCDLRDADFSFA